MPNATLRQTGIYWTLEVPITSPRVKEAVAWWGGRKKKGNPREFLFPGFPYIRDGLCQMLPDLDAPPPLEPYLRNFERRDVGQEDHPAWEKLYEWQRDMVDMGVSTPYPGVLENLAPRLGKTPTTLVILDLLKFQRVLIVAPLNLLYTWRREAKKWIGRDLIVCHGQDPSDGWVVTNYETVVNHLPGYMFEGIRGAWWDAIVFDESVMVKNRKAKRRDAMRMVRKRLNPRHGRVFPLSGSPTSRFIDDLWAQFNLIWPQGFTSYWRFVNHYCRTDETVWGINVVGTRTDVDFVTEFRDIMFVQDADSLGIFEKPVYAPLDLEMLPAQRKAYDALEDVFLAELDTGVYVRAASAMAQLTRLLEIASNLINVGGRDVSVKADVVYDRVYNDLVPFPCIIWVHWTRGARALRDRLLKPPRGQTAPTVELVLGDTKGVDEIIERFKSGEVDILIMSQGVGKYGHTLMNARTVIDFDWNFDGDAYYQKHKRIEGIGMEHAPTIIPLRLPGTVEDLVWENIEGKMRTVSQLTGAQLAGLIRSFKEAHA